MDNTTLEKIEVMKNGEISIHDGYTGPFGLGFYCRKNKAGGSIYVVVDMTRRYSVARVLDLTSANALIQAPYSKPDNRKAMIKDAFTYASMINGSKVTRMKDVIETLLVALGCKSIGLAGSTGKYSVYSDAIYGSDKKFFVGANGALRKGRISSDSVSMYTANDAILFLWVMAVETTTFQ